MLEKNLGVFLKYESSLGLPGDENAPTNVRREGGNLGDKKSLNTEVK